MIITHHCVYRGYRWHLTDNGRLDAVECQEGYYISGGGLEVTAIDRLVAAAHHWRLRGGPATRDFPGSFDGVPWEIHEIEDEDAYQIALASYKRESF